MSRIASILAAVTIFGATVTGVALVGAEVAAQHPTKSTAPVEVDAAPKPLALVAPIVAPVDAEPTDLTRDPIVVAAPIVIEPVEPAPVIEPTCPEATAEDGSCVPFSFYGDDDASSVPAAFYLTACPSDHFDESTEVACYWDAAAMGNGAGSSFVYLEGVYYYAE